MTNQQILEKAVQKAIDGGWKGGQHLNWSGDWMGEVPKLELKSPFPSWPILVYTTGGVNVEERIYPPEVMLFDHDFAKALWGAELAATELPDDYWLIKVDMFGNEETYELLAWQYHLQQMVIADEPIKYLGDHLYG